MSEIPNSVEEVTLLPQDSMKGNITETGLQGNKGSFPGFFLAGIQMFFAFASFFGNVLIIRVIHNLSGSKLRQTTKLLISFVSVSHCTITIVAVGRLFNMPCLLGLFIGYSSGFNILWGILFLAFEAFILVKKPHSHTRYVSVKICIFQILFSCLMTVGFNLAMYLTQKVPDDVSFCYMTNGMLNPWALGLPTCLMVAMIICAAVIQISTLRTLRKTSPMGTNTAPSPPSNLQAVPNPTVHPLSASQQISSNVKVVSNCTVDQPRIQHGLQETSSNLQVVPNTTVYPPSAPHQISSNLKAVPNCTVHPAHIPQETSSNVEVMPNCTVDSPHVSQETSSNVKVVPNCTIDPPHVPQDMLSNVIAVPNCTVDSPHVSQETSSNVKVVPNCTIDPPHVPQETSSNVKAVPNCTIDPPHVPQETSSNVKVVPNCTTDPPHVPQETSSNVKVVPNCTVDPPHVPQDMLSNVIAVPNPTVDPPHVPQKTLSNVQVVPNPTLPPPHVSQANSRRMSPLHKLTVILSISLLCFIICWLPLCLACITFSLLEILEIEVGVEGTLVTALSSLTMLSGCLHVSVYVVMSTQIRQALVKYVKSWWCLG